MADEEIEGATGSDIVYQQGVYKLWERERRWRRRV